MITIYYNKSYMNVISLTISNCTVYTLLLLLMMMMMR